MLRFFLPGSALIQCVGDVESVRCEFSTEENRVDDAQEKGGRNKKVQLEQKVPERRVRDCCTMESGDDNIENLGFSVSIWRGCKFLFFIFFILKFLLFIV